MAELICDHCLTTFPQKDALYKEYDGERKTFCCHGCLGVYELLHEEGLDQYYNNREMEGADGYRPIPGLEIDISPYEAQVIELDDIDNQIENEIDLLIEGIQCASCVWLNEKALSKTEGITYIRVNYSSHKAKIRWKPDIISLDKVLQRIIAIGYYPRIYTESEQYQLHKKESRNVLIRLGTAGFFSMHLMLYSAALYAGYFQGIEKEYKSFFDIIALLVATPVLFYSGYPFIRDSIKGLKRFHFNMDVLISLGSGSAYLYSVYQIFRGGEVFFDTSAMIITLILLGRFIEVNAKARASDTLKRLSDLSPKEARVIVDNERKKVPLNEVKVNDFIEVKPGERIPIDGVLIEGESEVNEALITGESNPVFKTIGEEVIGGSINLYGTFIFKVKQTGKDTVLYKIIQSVETAQENKPRIQNIADRIIGYFVPIILLTAISTILYYLYMGNSFEQSLMIGISVLVIACPCSLGLATPLAVLIFSGQASSKGILIKGGEVIENGREIDTLLFDKTGTITEGKPSLKEIIVLNEELSKEEILKRAVSIERYSEHSLAKALIHAYDTKDYYSVQNFKVQVGKGIEGEVLEDKIYIGSLKYLSMNNINCDPLQSIENKINENLKKGSTILYIAFSGKLQAVFSLSDSLREESKTVINQLKEKGCDLHIVSGDHELTTKAIASEAGIDINNIAFEASPEDKRKKIHQLQSDNKKVMMIGDGINDAPALSQAHVGAAMGKGVDIALDSADLVLVRNDLGLILDYLKLSKKTLSIIKQNLFWSFFYNILAIPLAVSGSLDPIFSALAMALSSVFVVLNSLRIKRS